jgi:hypothetical protein
MIKLDENDFAEFSRQVGLQLLRHPCLRRGQAMMNELYRIRPDLYNAIGATENDPFYQDSRIPNFIELIVDI